MKLVLRKRCTGLEIWVEVDGIVPAQKDCLAVKRMHKNGLHIVWIIGRHGWGFKKLNKELKEGLKHKFK